MGVTRTSDNRKLQSVSVADADKKFELLAKLEIAIKAKRAAADKRIADIKAKLAADTEDAVREYNELADWMDKYINANKERFTKPRMRKTEFGKYGLRTASKLHITNETWVIAAAKEKNLPLFEEKYRILKTAVEQALKNGTAIPGAEIISGDVAGFSVDKILLDAELKTQ